MDLQGHQVLEDGGDGGDLRDGGMEGNGGRTSSGGSRFGGALSTDLSYLNETVRTFKGGVCLGVSAKEWLMCRSPMQVLKFLQAARAKNTEHKTCITLKY